MKNISQFFELFAFSPNMDVLFVGEHPEIISRLNQKLEEVSGEVVQTSITNLPKTNKYEYVIAYNISDAGSLKLLRNIIANRGFIILLLKDIDKFKVYEELEKADFGAINAIDIFEDLDVVMAIKVHMWGMD